MIVSSEIAFIVKDRLKYHHHLGQHSDLGPVEPIGKCTRSGKISLYEGVDRAVGDTEFLGQTRVIIDPPKALT